MAKIKATLEEKSIERLNKAELEKAEQDREQEEIDKEVCFFELPENGNGKCCSHYARGTEFTNEKGKKIFYCAKHADKLAEIRMK